MFKKEKDKDRNETEVKYPGLFRLVKGCEESLSVT